MATLTGNIAETMTRAAIRSPGMGLLGLNVTQVFVAFNPAAAISSKCLLIAPLLTYRPHCLLSAAYPAMMTSPDAKPGISCRMISLASARA